MHVVVAKGTSSGILWGLPKPVVRQDGEIGEGGDPVYERMSEHISGRLIAAGRALAGVSVSDFAAAARVSPDALRELEAGGSAFVTSKSALKAINDAFKHFGIVVIDESDGMGAGVRLKFTRQDVSQIARLEGEGGIVASDDAP